jgi:hypothetical protein
MGLDAATPLLRLWLSGHLTDSQVEAAREVGRIYAAFERWHGPVQRGPSGPGLHRPGQAERG